jgi:hypothetical protein
VRAVFAAVRALPITFTLYVIEALIALTLTVPVASELTRDARALGARPIFRAAALERALELLPLLRVQGRTLALSALVLALLAPLLSMAWLSALGARVEVGRAFGTGARLYLRACLCSLSVALLLALALTPWGLFAYLVDTFIDVGTHARLHDLLLAGCLCTALPVLWLFHVAHDLAYAFALRHGALTAARLGLSLALSLRAELSALAIFVLSLLLGALPLGFGVGVSSLGELASMAFLQCSAFAGLFLRSVWLAYALTCTERDATSRERRD